MPINVPIDSSNPFLWWPLDDGTTHDATAAHRHGTASGDFALNVTGAESGRTALHLNPTGTVVSPALGLTTLTDFTLGLYVSPQPQATLPSSAIMVVGAAGTRGFSLNISYTSGAVAPLGRVNPAGQSPGAPTVPAPSTFWHWWCMTYTAASKVFSISIDGGTPINATYSGTPANLLATDTLQLISPIQLNMAHATLWTRVLTGAEITAIGGFPSQWPYTLPLNQGSGGGGGTGGGGLTEEQAAQLTDIQVKVADIPGLVSAVEFISDTVNTTQGLVDEIHSWVDEIRDDVALVKGLVTAISNSVGTGLHDLTENIWDGIRRVFQTAGGIGISTPLGALIAHPDPNLLSYSSDAFLLSGRGELTPPTGPFATRPYGIAWDATTVPPGAGFREGAETEFIGRLVQFCPLYPEVGSGILYIPEVADFSYKAFYWLWERYTPQVVQYDVTVGFELTCRWIVLL